MEEICYQSDRKKKIRIRDTSGTYVEEFKFLLIVRSDPKSIIYDNNRYMIAVKKGGQAPPVNDEPHSV